MKLFILNNKILLTKYFYFLYLVCCIYVYTNKYNILLLILKGEGHEK